MKRWLIVVIALFGCLLPAQAGAAEWHSEQPVSEGLGVATPLGAVGDIECWQANRCVAITQGNEAHPAGLYAYDGTQWYLYSEVCGGHDGRIAWAGPDEFWTISDQRVGQEVKSGGGESTLERRSLCHFAGGKVVASYAEPLGTSTSYLQMNAAACASPSDCWFAGERLPGTTNVGAFHLHWDGASLTAVPSLTQPQPTILDPGRKVSSLAYHGGRYYESVQPAEGDMPLAGEAPSRPPLIHRVSGTSFQAVPAPVEYPEGVDPTEVEGLHLGGDAESLWAAAGGVGEAPAPVSILRLQGAAFSLLTLQDPSAILATGDHVTGIAPEPGSESAWLGFVTVPEEGAAGQNAATLARVGAHGEVSEPTRLPAASEGFAHKGNAGPITCPAAGQCWMATVGGWLFHYGTSLPQDTDPAMHVLITSRPSDNGQLSLPPDELPEDDSGSELPAEEPAPLPIEKPRHKKPARTLVSAVKQKVVDQTLLVLSFKLHARAHVQLLAKQGKKVVAKTRRSVLGKGTHQLKLRLDRKRWPNHLAFEVHPLHVKKGKASSVTAAGAEPFLQAIATPSLASLTVPGATAVATTQSASEPQLTQVTVATSAPVAATPIGAPNAETVLGTPAVMFIGTSSAEAPGEVWGEGGDSLYRFTEAGGWELQPGAPVPAGGNVRFERGFPAAGRTTPAGGVAAFVRVGGEEGEKPGLLVRDPGGAPHLAPQPGAALNEGESLFREGSGGLPEPLVAFEAAAGGTGAFVAPATNSETSQTAILSYDASGWTREPICLSPAGEPCLAPAEPGFAAVAIDATSETNAWLLARSPTAGILLFHREEGEWIEQPLGGPLGEPFGSKEFEVGEEEVTVEPRTVGQPLVVTTAGLWIDAQLGSGAAKSEATLYLKTDAGQPSEAEVVASWCELTAATSGGVSLCTYPLGNELSQGAGRSFAWPPDGGSADPYGTRVVTGVGQGAILTLSGTAFTHQPLLGGTAGSAEGAALQSPTEGWLGAGAQPVRLTPTPHPSNLLTWPVPFSHPLTAIAPQPEAPIGAIGSQALAVGAEGEVARYVPGEGWQPEALLNGSQSRVDPTLRGVAWPTPGFAFAVGDNGEMWMWRKSTGLWESDPGKPPNLIRGNFTAVAFDPAEPERGYAVGQQGLLLGYGKQWTQEELPVTISPEANFNSLAFAGGEALVAYSYPTSAEARAGGLLVDDGTGWKVDEGAEAALAGAIPTLVAGLPDGGAVVATATGLLLERQGPGQPWEAVSSTASGVSALAAIRENGAVRAIVSAGPTIGTSSAENFSCPPGARVAREWECEQVNDQPAPGQPPLLIKAGLLTGGYLLRQNGSGWTDEQHQAYPLPGTNSRGIYDRPGTPDQLAALLVNPEGTQGWAVGGETGEPEVGGLETASVARYPADVASPNQSSSPIPSEGLTAIAVGGNDQCAAPCADATHTGIGPDTWLPHALATAAGVAGVGAFVYTGPGVAEGAASELGSIGFAREEGAYAERLSSASALPVFAAPAASDRDGTGSLAPFVGAMGAHLAPGTEATHAYYSFESGAATGAVRVIVLDYSLPALGAEQDCWLAQQLQLAGGAGQPAIVVGNRALDAPESVSNAAADGAEVVPILVTGEAPNCQPVAPPVGASAYFFDYPEQNRTLQLSAAGRSIPAYGSGTLGYVAQPLAIESDFVGASGFLVASVNVAQRNPATNVAPVTVRLIPNVAELAVNALDGTLLHRSHQALFEAVARRPRSGFRCTNRPGEAAGTCEFGDPDPYVTIPPRCQGARCGTALLPEYRFTSSRPGVASFVAADPRSLNPRAVLLEKGKPVPDPTSALLCAYNEGETIVTAETGGLSYSVKVTVQAGSVQQPCGTVPVENPPFREPQVGVPPPPPSPIPLTHFKTVPTVLPTPPSPPIPSHPHVTVVHHHHQIPKVKNPPKAPEKAEAPPYIFNKPELIPRQIIIPPAPPPAVEPTPPSGTSPVTQPAVSPEPEEEEEAAFDMVHHATAIRHLPRATAADAAYRVGSRGSGSSVPAYGVPVLVLIAALSTCGIAGRRRRRDPEPAFLQYRR